MKNNWEDCTPRKLGKNEEKSSCWTLSTSKLTIIVTNGHIHYKPDWIMYCHELNMNTVQIRVPADTPVEEVQWIAREMVIDKLNVMLNSLNQ